LVVKEVKFPMLKGQPSTQPFEMLCKASIPDN
jgi:hypothetical protein